MTDADPAVLQRLDRLIELFESSAVAPVVMRWESISQALPTTPELYRETVIAAPSKMELAIAYLRDHPEDAKLPGRDLEKKALPMGVKISYRYWNDAKARVG